MTLRSVKCLSICASHRSVSRASWTRLQLAVQRLSADAQLARRLGDVAPAVFQGLLDSQARERLQAVGHAGGVGPRGGTGATVPRGHTATRSVRTDEGGFGVG